MAENGFFLVMLISALWGSVFYALFLIKETGSIITHAYTELYAQIYKEHIPRDTKKRIHPKVLISGFVIFFLLTQGPLWTLEFKKEIQYPVQVFNGILFGLNIVYIFFFSILKWDSQKI